MKPAEQIRAARISAQLSQADAAVLLGISKRTLEYIEAGERSLPSERDVLTFERAVAKLTAAKPEAKP